MVTQSKQQIIKKLVTFTKEEWDFIQSYKHSNKLKTDMQAIKLPILEKKILKQEAFDNFFSNKNNSKILTKLSKK